MKSRNIVFTGPRKVEWLDEDVPDPGAGCVTVQTIVSLLSTGTESWCYRGEFDADTGWAGWVQYPFNPGYSNVGHVVKVGPGVTDMREGDRVFSAAEHRQFANVKASGSRFLKLPDHARDEDAAWATLSFITQTAVRHAEHSMGDNAVVIGLGPLGQLVTQYLRLVGCGQVLAIDVAPKRLEMAKARGATATFCGSVADAVGFVQEHTGGRLADVVYDVTGHFSVFPLALKLPKQFGTLVLLGDTPHPSRQHLTHDLMTRQLRVIGTHNEKLPPAHSHWTAPRQMALFLEYVRRGQMTVSDLVTHRHSPVHAAQVYEALQKDRGETMGILFDWNDVR